MLTGALHTDKSHGMGDSTTKSLISCASSFAAVLGGVRAVSTQSCRAVVQPHFVAQHCAV